ncbi:MAG: aminodeoxychorismate synthase component I [Microbacterium sp.]
MSEVLMCVALDAWQDPASVHDLVSSRGDDTFWLDAGPGARAGWSWVGEGRLESDPERVRALPCATAGEDVEGGRFRGGWVGWLGYEDAASRAGAPTAPVEPAVAQVAWLRVERYVAFDHAAQVAWAFAPAHEVDGFRAFVDGAGEPIAAEGAAPLGLAIARDLPREYAALIERCRDAIREGDAYQLCLTTRFRVEAEVDEVSAYRRLRTATPAHHGGIVRAAGVALASASPERFLEVGDGIVRTRPIKGTRPRGRDAEEDLALARELRESEKERAENVMIVDLMRNDLSRVCAPGSVGVDGLLQVESYPAVHQLVSTVSGRLVEGTTVGDLLDATFPAGSMTGAPKLSAMTILHDLEDGPRGVFAGCFGWIGDDGALDLAMVIRSIVVHPGGAYVGAGGGITWRSDAAAEVQEVGVKARGPLAALGATLPDGW